MASDVQAIFQRQQLHRAAAAGDVIAVEKLLAQGYPVNRFDDLGKTPLHYAVAAGETVIVERLLKAGANVNAHDERISGNTPLADNVATCSMAMVKCLLDAGADPTISGWMGMNALDRAAKRTDSALHDIILPLRSSRSQVP